MRFQYSCVTCGDKLKELEYIMEQSKEIGYGAFKKKVNQKDWNEIMKSLGYGPHFPIERDYHVSFESSQTEDGKPVVFMNHSAIEYVFYD